MQGLDSEVGQWKAASTSLSYDYGSYSSPLTPDKSWKEYRACDVKIGNRPARLVLARTHSGEYFVGAHWPALRASSLGAISLTVSGAAPDVDGQRVLLASLWTVRIRD